MVVGRDRGDDKRVGWQLIGSRPWEGASGDARTAADLASASVARPLDSWSCKTFITLEPCFCFTAMRKVPMLYSTGPPQSYQSLYTQYRLSLHRNSEAAKTESDHCCYMIVPNSLGYGQVSTGALGGPRADDRDSGFMPIGNACQEFVQQELRNSQSSRRMLLLVDFASAASDHTRLHCCQFLRRHLHLAKIRTG